ncbi:hypothetical protein TrCOL_g1371 [Triparma columacea]|uniref:Uncharacterized protein n=1 Tax=Triparma columacea TaxID=722753 RepID=A0A9W7L514_9STRA|nr:hypothetical protein TrCOL_g1371 [Triparma columacea]
MASKCPRCGEKMSRGEQQCRDCNSPDNIDEPGAGVKRKKSDQRQTSIRNFFTTRNRTSASGLDSTSSSTTTTATTSSSTTTTTTTTATSVPLEEEEAVVLTTSLGYDATASNSNSLATSMANVLNLVSPRYTEPAMLLPSLFSLSPVAAQAAATQLSGASDAMPPNSTLATALRESAHAQFHQISNSLMTNNYGHTLYRESPSRFLLLTSWPLSSNHNMTTTPSPVANHELPVTYSYQLQNEEVCTTGAISITIAADLTGDPNANILDLNPISVDTATAPTNNNSGAYTAPPFNGQVMAALSATLLRATFDESNASPHSVIIVQSRPAIRALLAAAPPLGIIVHRTDPERLFNTFGLLMEQIDFGGAGNFGIYLLQRGTRFVLVVGVPSAALATGGPVSFNRNGVIMTTFNVMQMSLALTGQPLLNNESSTYITVTRPSSSDRAMTDVLERCDPDASYSTPSQRGGRIGNKEGKAEGGRIGNKEGKAAGGRKGRGGGRRKVDDAKASAMCLYKRRSRAKADAAIAAMPPEEAAEAEEERKRKNRDRMQKSRDKKKAREAEL